MVYSVELKNIMPKTPQNMTSVLTLYPYAEIPFSEKWIFENKELLEKFKHENVKNEET